jgi:putative endonuclease
MKKLYRSTKDVKIAFPGSSMVPACRQAGSSRLLRKMEYYVYALVSEKDKTIYIGISKNVEERIKQHNAGMTKSTKSKRPLKLFYKEKCATLKEARLREKYFKSGCGREYLKTIIPR